MYKKLQLFAPTLVNLRLSVLTKLILTNKKSVYFLLDEDTHSNRNIAIDSVVFNCNIKYIQATHMTQMYSEMRENQLWVFNFFCLPILIHIKKTTLVTFPLSKVIKKFTIKYINWKMM